MGSEQRRKAEKAARIYLNMRRYEILEQNWSSGRSKIDIIARKGDVIYFGEIRLQLPTSGTELETASRLSKRLEAAEAYLAETKLPDHHGYFTITLLAPSLSVIGFSEDLL